MKQIQKLNEQILRNEFLSKISPEFTTSIPNCLEYVEKIPIECVNYLLKNVYGNEWFDHLVLASISLVFGKIVHIYGCIAPIHLFLTKEIPSNYRNLTVFNPKEALERGYSNETRGISSNRDRRYCGIQKNVELLLLELPDQQTETLQKYILPRIVKNELLRKKRKKSDFEAQESRKSDVEDLLPHLWDLYQLALLRFKWIKEFMQTIETNVQENCKNSAHLPVEIYFRNIDDTRNIRFLLWTSSAWDSQHPSAIQKKRQLEKNFPFIQLVDTLPEDDWFFSLIQKGLFSDYKQIRKDMSFENLNIRQAVFPTINSFLPSEKVRYIHHAQKTARNVNENCTIFSIFPFYIASLLGLLSFSLIISTAMRIGELIQISYDHECLRTELLGSIDYENDRIINGKDEFFIYLFPKNSQERKKFRINGLAISLLSEWIDICKINSPNHEISKVNTRNINQFRHSWKFPTQMKFLFQWDGCQLCEPHITSCLQFLTMNSLIVNKDNQQFRLTPHLLRHCVSTILRIRGIEVVDLMNFLNHLNKTATLYYGKIPEEIIFSKLRPLLEKLGDEVNLDTTHVISFSSLNKIEIEIAKNIGMFSSIPGGICSCDHLCPVEFSCSDCFFYGVDIHRINEIQESIKVFTELSDQFTKDGQEFLSQIVSHNKKKWEKRLYQAQIEKQIQESLSGSLYDYLNEETSAIQTNHLSEAVLNLSKECE
ncbi:MAG: hypothetical protein CVU43_02445 [Chloroflexi bacterium HGW-Chloroflexi-5]|jgi:hypothetical protein|nr:MAG: hypothetical protein CVU43_02445 [Chloroflexi bacterium HGW-Chloroflexi-5]